MQLLLCVQHCTKGTIFNEELRKAFIKRLTVDSPHHDARRKDFNQAIFDADEGFACFNGTDLDMVLEKFDAAVRDLTTYQKR